MLEHCRLLTRPVLDQHPPRRHAPVDSTLSVIATSVGKFDSPARLFDARTPNYSAVHAHLPDHLDHGSVGLNGVEPAHLDDLLRRPVTQVATHDYRSSSCLTTRSTL
jgi:hypothetical protein